MTSIQLLSSHEQHAVARGQAELAQGQLRFIDSALVNDVLDQIWHLGWPVSPPSPMPKRLPQPSLPTGIGLPSAGTPLASVPQNGLYHVSLGENFIDQIHALGRPEQAGVRNAILHICQTPHAQLNRFAQRLANTEGEVWLYQQAGRRFVFVTLATHRQLVLLSYSIPSVQAAERKIAVPYTAEISRQYPACILFLLDQSSSMGDKFDGGKSKAQFLSDVINRVLRELGQRCTKEEEVVYDYFEVGVIGYGKRVAPALIGDKLQGRELVLISEIANNPARIDLRVKKVSDGLDGLREEQIRVPVWLDPVANNGTPMCAALREASALLRRWVAAHQSSFPPIVINITDGASTDGDPRGEAESLRSLATSDGNVLLFNLHVSSGEERQILFPDTIDGIHNEFARQLFDMSSPLPEYLKSELRKAEYTIGHAARSFVFNADIVQVITVLDIGTRPDQR